MTARKKNTRQYDGKTLAYKRFVQGIWNTQKLLEFGVAGIDANVEKSFGGLLEKFSHIKGVPGRAPENYEPVFSTKREEDGNVLLTMDNRSAAMIKKSLENSKKRHDDLRYFLHSNMCVSIWAAFETYNQMLFEELLKMKPEMLKSKENITVESVISNNNNIVDFLIERQLESIGHFKIGELLEYLKSKLNFSASTDHINKLTEYYIMRNIIAHKSGIVRESQKSKLPRGVRCIDNEIQITENYLKLMLQFISKIVTEIEKLVESKFFKSAKV